MLPNTWLFPYNNIVLMQIYTPVSKEHPVHAVSEHFYFAVNVKQKCWARHERLADSEREHSQLPIRTLDLWKRSYTLLSSVKRFGRRQDIMTYFQIISNKIVYFSDFFSYDPTVVPGFFHRCENVVRKQLFVTGP